MVAQGAAYWCSDPNLVPLSFPGTPRVGRDSTLRFNNSLSQWHHCRRSWMLLHWRKCERSIDDVTQVIRFYDWYGHRLSSSTILSSSQERIKLGEKSKTGGLSGALVSVLAFDSNCPRSTPTAHGWQNEKEWALSVVSFCSIFVFSINSKTYHNICKVG